MNAFQYVTQRCNDYGMDRLEVCGPGRSRHLVEVRAKIARELRSSPWNLSLPAIGHELGRDHTTILSMLRGGKRKSPQRAPCHEDHFCADSYKRPVVRW